LGFITIHFITYSGRNTNQKKTPEFPQFCETLTPGSKRTGIIIRTIILKTMRPIIIWAAIIFSCCNNNSTPEKKVEAQKEKDREAIERSYSTTDMSGCFWKISGRDTLVAWLAQTENTITGKLSFDNFETDGSSGPVHGTVEGDIAKLWYSFESEGMKSVMEVWYKKQGDSLLRAVGPSKVKGDSSYFADQQAIKFDNKQSFVKVDCDELPGKYK
jgi:hypothetical protein